MKIKYENETFELIEVSTNRIHMDAGLNNIVFRTEDGQIHKIPVQWLIEITEG